LLEQFNEKLDNELRLWLLDQKPKTLVEAARLADQYMATHRGHSSRSFSRDYEAAPQVSSGEATGKVTDEKTSDKRLTSSVRSTSAFTSLPHNKQIKCFNCQEKGHIASRCPKPKFNGSEKFKNANVSLVTTFSNELLPLDDCQVKADLDQGFAPYVYSGVIVQPTGVLKKVTLLRDTGALQSLVRGPKSDFIDTSECRLIRGISGEVTSVPLVELKLQSKLWTGTFLVGVTEFLPVGIDILIGNDIESASQSVDNLVVTRAQTAAQREASEPVSAVSEPVTQMSDSDLHASGVSYSEDLSNEFSSLFAEHINISDITNRAEFIALQQNDCELVPLFDLASETDHTDLSKAVYLVKDGVLMRSWRDRNSPGFPNASIEQVVVPRALREQLLKLAHDIPAAAHLGMTKTLQRLQQHFYWRSINSDVKNWCRTCDACQRLGKGGVPPRAPLHSLPVVNEPFHRVAIDIVGPLPVCKNSNNRFVLTILDLATHFPEAVPLQQHTAKEVAQALISVFTRYGFPVEILSDQGTDFMSELMQIFMHDFCISHIHCSAWHPETNGACEKFNGVLKNMLRALGDKFLEDWDLALPLGSVRL
jgi:hypothetical protein